MPWRPSASATFCALNGRFCELTYCNTVSAMVKTRSTRRATRSVAPREGCQYFAHGRAENVRFKSKWRKRDSHILTVCP